MKYEHTQKNYSALLFIHYIMKKNNESAKARAIRRKTSKQAEQAARVISSRADEQPPEACAAQHGKGREAQQHGTRDEGIDHNIPPSHRLGGEPRPRRGRPDREWRRCKALCARWH